MADTAEREAILEDLDAAARAVRFERRAEALRAAEAAAARVRRWAAGDPHAAPGRVKREG